MAEASGNITIIAVNQSKMHFMNFIFYYFRGS